jgi:1,4-alpha-glucan branching enzyme
MFTQQRLGARQVGTGTNQGAAEFRVFFPDRDDLGQVDLGSPNASGRAATYGDPQVSRIQVVGDFQGEMGQAPWDFNAAPDLTSTQVPGGVVWSFTTPVLPADFYEYKYRVTFNDTTVRIVGDPCARYGGSRHQNSAFVIGGSPPAQNAVAPIVGGRRPLRDLVQYELMIDDFTDEYRGGRAPLDAVRDKIPYLHQLGINAILFMPWTSWPDEHFSWGYTPHQYFAVEYRYANDLAKPSEKLSWLKHLINDCHAAGIHVIMDGVFNHVGDPGPQANVAFGFPYRWLYQDIHDCPYTGKFGGAFGGLQDIDYHNPCTQEYIGDVCFYWMDEFGIDGIRFDNTTNFVLANDLSGLPALISDINNHAGDPNFSTTLEHLDMSAADVTNRVGATSYWNNELYARTFDYLWEGRIDARIMGALENHVGLPSDRVATTYLGNHDHSHVAWQAGARGNAGALQWFRGQPYAIALLTTTGAPMIQNGQEFAEDYWIMEDDRGSHRRVKPRPLRWGFADDNIGGPLREVYRRLITIRNQYPALRTDNFYPSGWQGWQTSFNPEGYGVDVARSVVIFHRWGHNAAGQLERFIIVLNFSDQDQAVDLPFSSDGQWVDVLNNFSVSVSNTRIPGFVVYSNWGNVFVKTG